jgi:hypothetical protein
MEELIVSEDVTLYMMTFIIAVVIKASKETTRSERSSNSGHSILRERTVVVVMARIGLHMV